ncbi:hypothetical protein HYU12_03230 [Candidatus Woesearchaeota archaeon]|nr:hypothetical protein [Candidatus Woesearchaeota archaeon]
MAEFGVLSGRLKILVAVTIILGSLWVVDYFVSFDAGLTGFDVMEDGEPDSIPAQSQPSRVQVAQTAGECQFKETGSGPSYRSGYECSKDSILYTTEDKCLYVSKSQCSPTYSAPVEAEKTTPSSAPTAVKDMATDLTLDKGSHWLKITPSVKGKKLSDVTGDCNVAIAYFYDELANSYTLIGPTFELKEETVGKTLWLNVESPCKFYKTTAPVSQPSQEQVAQTAGECQFKETGSGPSYRSGYECSKDSIFYTTEDKCLHSSKSQCSPTYSAQGAGSASSVTTATPSSASTSPSSDTPVDGVDVMVVEGKTRAENFQGDKFRAKVVLKNRGNVPVDSNRNYYFPDNNGMAGGASVGVSARILKGEDVVCSDDGAAGNHPIGAGNELALTVPLVTPGNQNPCSLENGAYNLVVKAVLSSDRLDVDRSNDAVRIPFQFGSGSGSCPGDAPVGFRTSDGVYCDSSKVFSVQKLPLASCTNSFECLGNLCLGGVCAATCTLRNGVTGEVTGVVTAGSVVGGLYCGIGSDGKGVMKVQKQDGFCSDDFECASNVCGAGNCVPEAKLNEALCRIGVIKGC